MRPSTAPRARLAPSPLRPRRAATAPRPRRCAPAARPPLHRAARPPRALAAAPPPRRHRAAPSPLRARRAPSPPPLASLNHISIVCRSVEASLRFYTDVLGFVPIRRPGSFDFDGAWLFNYGIGIHLLQSEDPGSLPPEKGEINPKDNHISFQVSCHHS
ncbi:uncharacterized protein [Zea mays]|uniref:uncharacterized protein n=1 Tax=Zea mays TaxID=4577 RepID=UPI0004DE80A5|nr:uncharacterized protein LOC103648836 [Zea mays]|eukprot:XP_008671456.1 uncharacterized protein LOC103648836 [Zea mays]